MVAIKEGFCLHKMMATIRMQVQARYCARFHIDPRLGFKLLLGTGSLLPGSNLETLLKPGGPPVFSSVFLSHYNLRVSSCRTCV